MTEAADSSKMLLPNYQTTVTSQMAVILKYVKPQLSLRAQMVIFFSKLRMWGGDPTITSYTCVYYKQN